MVMDKGRLTVPEHVPDPVEHENTRGRAFTNRGLQPGRHVARGAGEFTLCQRILTCRMTGTEIPIPACTSNIAGQCSGLFPLIRVSRIGALMLNPRPVVARRSTPTVSPLRVVRSLMRWYPPMGVSTPVT
jgi:hypothetical protein